MSEVICRLLDERPSYKDQKPGDMWFIQWLLDEDLSREEHLKVLSAKYFERNSKRPPIVIVLPGGAHWLVDSNASGSRSGWDVSGEPPKLTARPSIYANKGHKNEYHGFLTDGVLRSC